MTTDLREQLQATLGDAYTLERELGRGGMATIYLARDLRHRRAVAVKLLHPELSALLGPERFLREIELTANLQHAHILPLFDSGSAGGLLYYVMPYVEGESLRARLERERQLPVDDAVRLAREVADALAYAHARGVVHRDVKPENILLQHGHALVADFGIALAVEQAGGTRMTQTGLSLGTPQYMAPEQAAAERAVDARADVYALGAVLYEMLAGEPPFTGTSAQAVIAKVMTDDAAPLTRHRRSVPPHVEAAVFTALEKLPADRYPTAEAFGAALGGAQPSSGVPIRSRTRLSHWPKAGVAAVAIGALALAWQIGRMSPTRKDVAEVQRPVRFTIELDSAVLGEFSRVAFSPDGHTLVYAAEGTRGVRLYVRRLDELTARPLAGTEEAEQPFFSPDGAWIAFFSYGALRKVRLDGGAPVVVTQLPASWAHPGGSWGPGDTILYTSWYTLYRVSAGGGTPSRVRVADSSLRLLHPHILPGGRAVLVTMTPNFSTAFLGVLDLASGRVRQLGPGSGPQYVAGRLVYGLAGDLYQQPFDLERLQPSGPAEQIATGVNATSFATAAVGALAYHETSVGSQTLRITDGEGREQRVLPVRNAWWPRFSPDGRHVVYQASAPGRNDSEVWVTDVGSGATQRLTNDGNSHAPTWSPDGRAIAYSGKGIFVRSLAGGPARLVAERPGTPYVYVTDWVPDGSALLFTIEEDGGSRPDRGDIWIQPLDSTGARPYVATPGREVVPRVSPDGRWVAYQSDESGSDEVYVQAYPTPGLKTLVSAGGGTNPVWRGDGRELYYVKGHQLFAVSISLRNKGDAPVLQGLTPLLGGRYFGNYLRGFDASPHGKRFALLTAANSTSRLVVVLHALNAGGPGHVGAVNGDSGRRR